ncbi:MAG TPA: outer membrane beta-barrel protein [Pyrinomonadaceae bacterium]|nr:outer membrane beta-barrel protein [Pyrinomonadaceae bacterium]
MLRAEHFAPSDESLDGHYPGPLGQAITLRAVGAEPPNPLYRALGSVNHLLKRLINLTAAVAIVMSCLLNAAAQDDLTPPKAEVKATFGGAAFDETSHSVFGGSARFYVTRRLSVEPEFLYMRNSDTDQDYLFQPNVAFDLSDPTGRFVPYVIGGAGVIHHQARFPGFDFSSGVPRVFDASFTTWTASAGAGVKIFVTDRLFVSPEARLGREPNLRATISVGYVFSGRKRD